MLSGKSDSVLESPRKLPTQVSCDEVEDVSQVRIKIEFKEVNLFHLISPTLLFYFGRLVCANCLFHTLLAEN